MTELVGYASERGSVLRGKQLSIVPDVELEGGEEGRRWEDRVEEGKGRQVVGVDGKLGELEFCVW